MVRAGTYAEELPLPCVRTGLPLEPVNECPATSNVSAVLMLLFVKGTAGQDAIDAGRTMGSLHCSSHHGRPPLPGKPMNEAASITRTCWRKCSSSAKLSSLKRAIAPYGSSRSSHTGSATSAQSASDEANMVVAS